MKRYFLLFVFLLIVLASPALADGRRGRDQNGGHGGHGYNKHYGKWDKHGYNRSRHGYYPRRPPAYGYYRAYPVPVYPAYPPPPVYGYYPACPYPAPYPAYGPHYGPRVRGRIGVDIIF
ncbi:MAG: hypothetical protein EHM61_03610 [Acidobacteria bacterium]|nr:MAG: hypothetical protein EHM61_03610 [Acidobacteriota bacterium]